MVAPARARQQHNREEAIECRGFAPPGKTPADRVVVDGKALTVRAEQLSEANRYVGGVTLNGKPLARTFLRHDDTTAGDELVFTMQASPNKDWGKGRSAQPYTQTRY